MEQNIYAPPVAAVADAAQVRKVREFYVVSKGKFITLFVITFGWYQLAWAYLHWARIRRFHRKPVLPAARSIFQIFFQHALARYIATSLKRAAEHAVVEHAAVEHAAVEHAAQPHRWSPRWMATALVLAQLGNAFFSFLGQADELPSTSSLFAFLLLVPIALAMWRMQAAANIACDDPRGDGNRRLGWANWIWIVLGGLLWLSMGLGLIGLLLGA